MAILAVCWCRKYSALRLCCLMMNRWLRIYVLCKYYTQLQSLSLAYNMLCAVLLALLFTMIMSLRIGMVSIILIFYYIVGYVARPKDFIVILTFLVHFKWRWYTYWLLRSVYSRMGTGTRGVCVCVCNDLSAPKGSGLFWVWRNTLPLLTHSMLILQEVVFSQSIQ